MNISNIGLATTAFLSCAGAGLAEQQSNAPHFESVSETPESIVYDRINGSDFVSFVREEAFGGGFKTHEARIDYALGILCEWDVVSRYDIFSKQNEVSVKNVSCMNSGDEIPEWFSEYWSMQPQLTPLWPVLPVIINQDTENLNVVFENHAAFSFFDEGYVTSKTWDFGKDKIRIEVGRVFNGDASGSLIIDLGWHSILNQGPKSEVSKYFSIQPAELL